jgi:hypothetical protein
MTKALKSLPIQSALLQKIKSSLPTHLGLAEDMADVLGVSTDSAYRRIRCETELSIDEAHLLVKKYNISMDGIFASLGDTVAFAYTKLTDDPENFKKYLQRIYGHTKQINTFADKKIIYIAETFPLFYSFFSNKLAQLKLFYWQKSVLNVPFYQGKKFEYGIVPEDLVELATNAFKEYQKIPCVEVWTNETINTVLQQIEFYAESGAFLNQEDALGLVEEVRKMAKYLESCAESGRKLPGDANENFTLFCSEVVLGTNCIYIQTGGTKYAYISFNTLNSLTTNNLEFCEESEHWVKNIIKKSNMISGVSEKQRFQFFNRMHANIDNCYARIQKA